MNQKEQDVVPLIRRATAAYLALIWVVAAVAAALAVWLLLTRAASQTQATALGLEQYARRNIEISAFVADDFRRHLTHAGTAKALAGDAGTAAELQRLMKRLPEGTVSIFVRADGSVALSTVPLPAASVNLSDRRWFRAHVDDGVKSYIGPGIRSRVFNRIIYTYSESYFDQGRLVGILNLGIPSDSIIGLAPDPELMSVALVQHEGLLVAAKPISDELLGRPFDLSPPASAAPVTGLARAFGQVSMTTVRDLPDQGLYAMASVPLVSVLKPAILGIAGGAALLVLLSAALRNLSRVAQEKSRQVEQALADNKVLFQEVHHRVKNNLQVISSLIRLQTDRLPAELRPMMEQTAARVRAIAMVHEQIYMTAKPSEVQLDLFLECLLPQIEASMMARGIPGFTTRLAPVTVGLDQAVPVALLATEAITNAIKHGITGREVPIGVGLTREADRIVLRIDNGGTLGDGDVKKGLGSRIMTALARQIEGNWSLEPGPSGGTVFTLAWPAPGAGHAPVQSPAPLSAPS